MQDSVEETAYGANAFTVDDLLLAHAQQTPDAVAIASPGRAPLTYGRVAEQVGYTTGFLNAIDIGRNDRVAIVLRNGPEMAVAVLGVLSCAVGAPLNPAYSEAEFEFYISDLNVKALIIEADVDSPAIAAAERLRIPIVELSPSLHDCAGIFTLRGAESFASKITERKNPDDLALLLYTSGSTARPKRVPLAQRNICISAHNVKAALQLTDRDRCLNVMPLYHIHGLVGALLSSLAAGASIALPPEFDSDRFFDWLEELQPTWYTAVPTIHHAILNSARDRLQTGQRHPLRFIRSSSAPMPLRLMTELEEIFKVPVIEAYGMTEASHQIASNPLPPKKRKPGSVGVAAGSELAIRDESGNFLPSREIGEVVLRGPNIIHAYDDNRESHDETFADGWFRTGDQGYLDDDGYLFLTGRLKEIINRGGEKVSPREVDDVLLDHPAVDHAVTFGVPHPTLGEEVAAVVVLRPQTLATASELKKFCASKLALFKVPKQIAFVDAIPRSATGKLQRVGLAQTFRALFSERRIDKFLAPLTQTEKTLAAIWSEVLGVEPIGVDDNFFDLGGDSIRAAQVISRVREPMHTELPIAVVFETPTLAGLAARIDTPDWKEPLLQVSPLLRVARHEDLPLSFAQQRLWFLNQLEPADPVYNRPLALRISGRLQAEIIARCLNETIRRHEVLRTNFQANDGKPFQVIAPKLSVDLPLIDLSHLPDGQRESEALRLATGESRQPFDLARGPLLRPHLYRLSEQDHLLVVVTHHIVFDGWSDGVLLKEIAALYQAFINDEPSPLPELPIQYADYAAWQRQRVEEVEERAIDTNSPYWKQLKAPSLPLDLITDRPRPAIQTYRGARREFALPPELSKKLQALSSREQVTLFMTLVAAFNTLLYRYTGQADISVGVPTAGRNRVETEPLLGVFLNILVFRTDLSGEPSFRELLGRMRDVAVGAYAQQDLPFEMLMQVSQAERDLSRNPLFDVMFQLRNMPQHDFAIEGLRVDCIDLDIGVAKYDLTLEAIDKAAGLEFRFEYNTDLFDCATIDRMAGHYQKLLESIVADSEQRISEVPLLTAAEKNQLLVEWNNTQRNYSKDKCIHQLFEEQVERTPEAAAVVFEDQQLTYRELNTRANRLARYLQKLGVARGVLVGICVERSIEMVIGLLGILKAGAAYVPLDPSYPKDRLAFMLEDAQPKVVLIQARLRGKLPAGSDEVLCLDAEWDVISQESGDNPTNEAAASELAYVIYTSGSTGNPKGVMIPHSSIVNYLNWMQDDFRFSETDAIVLKSSFSFDASIWELFAPLIAGSRLILAQPHRDYDSNYLCRLIQTQRATVLQFVPSTLRLMLQNEDFAACTALRLVFCGGEPLPGELAQKFYASFGPSAKLWNLYGPTEASIAAAYWECERDSEEAIVPIGRPRSDTQLYLLDAHMNPVPISVVGEIYIGGAGLASGYLNRPELTAERFIYHSFDGEPAQRLYRTGDMARYLPDGKIVFLGRIDNQIKLRGYRIEPGEIEAVLAQHPAVREIVVLASADKTGDKRLVAYIVPRFDSLAIGQLREYLKTKLPGYMVPSVFVVLEALPLTPNRKIDRAALPSADCDAAVMDRAYVGPRNAAEEIIAAVWSEVLGINRVGIHDDFFELGGHSLKAAQVVSRLRKAFQNEITLRDLFDFPTIAELARVIGGEQETRLEAIDVMVTAVETMSEEKARKLLT